MDYVVKPIARRRAKRLICRYHYSMTLPPTIYTFGLFGRDDFLEGACCFGLGANNKMMLVAKEEGWEFLELVRLCLKNNEKNAASFFVGNCLRSLPKGILVVSYADITWGHSGKIYQATNWLYTGLSAAQKVCVDGKGESVHKRSMSGRLGMLKESRLPDSVKLIDGIQKHRYFYCLGKTKVQKRLMREWVDKRFGIRPYPLEDTQRYDIDELRKEKQERSGVKGFGL